MAETDTDDWGATERLAPADRLDAEALIVHRAKHNFVVLNLFPYTNGHVMVVPYEHVDSLAGATAEVAMEMMELVRRTEGVIRSLYNPPGINIGMNLGACAGAGVAGHIHMHVLPRWPGDANRRTTNAADRASASLRYPCKA